MQLARIITAVLVCAVATFTGCVSPGHTDITDITKLQQRILNQGPQDRAENGLGLMTPKSNLPRLHTITDPKTKRVKVSLSLNEAISRALANNTSIAISSYIPELTKQDIINAASAFDLQLNGGWSFQSSSSSTKRSNPTFGLSKRFIYGTSVQLNSSFDRSYRSGTSSTRYAGDVSIRLTQPLLRGFGLDANLYQFRVSSLRYQTSKSEFREVVLNTLRDVMVGYYDLVRTKKDIEISARLLRRTEAILELIKKRREFGFKGATVIEENQILAAVKGRKSALLNAQKAYQDAQESFAVLLADSEINVLKNPEIIPTTKLLDSKIAFSVADQLKSALKYSPVLEQARIAIKNSDLQVRYTKNQLLPALNLDASLRSSGSDKSQNVMWNEVLKSQRGQYNIGLSFSYPLGNRAAESRYASARLQRQQAKIRIQRTADSVALQVKELVRRIELSYNNLQLQRTVYKASKKQLEGMTALYGINEKGTIEKDSVGGITPLSVNIFLQTQASIAQAELAIAQAIQQYNSAIVQLQALTGELIKAQNIDLANALAEPLPETNIDSIKPKK